MADSASSRDLREMLEGKCIGLIYLVRATNEALLLLDAEQNCKCHCDVDGGPEEFVKDDYNGDGSVEVYTTGIIGSSDYFVPKYFVDA